MAGVGHERSRWAELPWSRALMFVAVVGPPLWLGGVKPWVIPCFCLVVAGLLLRRGLRSGGRGEALQLPWLWWLGLAAAGLTLVQWLPLPGALLDLLAPGLRAEVAAIVAGTPAEGWNRLTVHPGETGLEFARLLGLSGLFVAAAQLRWRLVAAYVAVAGTVVALIGFGHQLLGAEAIYGLYVPRQLVPGLGQQLGAPLLTSFVNPNHQSGLLLLGVFAAAGVAADLHRGARESADRRARERDADRAYLAVGAAAIQATALVLSMSRAALLAGALVVPVALVLVLRRRPRGSAGGSGQAMRRRLGLAAVVLAMLGLALSQGAHRQLASLRDPASFTEKFRVAREGLALIPLSPVLGTGRGSFVDLFALVDRAPGTIRFTHLESTPVAFVVEWGPLPGGLLVAALGLWWARSFRAKAGLGRRLALCGLLALAIQSLADFSLDYLGVSAAAVALAGALGVEGRKRPTDAARHPTRKLVAATLGAGAAALAVALVSIPASWSQRQPRDRAVLAGERPVGPALRDTPLDFVLHLVLARELAAAEDWEGARTRAAIATRLWPASIDARLVTATAAAALDEPLAAVEELRLGLEGLREPVPEALLDWLIASTSEPEQLATVAPRSPEAWTALARSLARRAPAHAVALAQARLLTHPDDPEPLRLLANLALLDENPGLGLHYARLWVQLRPDDSQAIGLRARARFAHRDPKHDAAAVAELEQSRTRVRLDDPAAVDELLITALLRVGDPPALDRAEELLDALMARRAKPRERQRRRELAEALRAARSPSRPRRGESPASALGSEGE